MICIIIIRGIIETLAEVGSIIGGGGGYWEIYGTAMYQHEPKYIKDI